MNAEKHTLEMLDEGDDVHVTIKSNGEEKTLPLTVAWVKTGGTPKAQVNYDGAGYGKIHGYQRDNTIDSEVKFLPTTEDRILTVVDIEQA